DQSPRFSPLAASRPPPASNSERMTEDAGTCMFWWITNFSPAPPRSPRPPRPATQRAAPRRRTAGASRPRPPASPPPFVPGIASPYADGGAVAGTAARSPTHPVGRHRVGGRPHEQVAVHQHRGDGHPPPPYLLLLTPAATAPRDSAGADFFVPDGRCELKRR